MSWRWYSHDYVPMLWLVDPEFGLNHEAVPSYFDRKDLLGGPSFLDHAAAGKLPAVSWIDPNFTTSPSAPPAPTTTTHPPTCTPARN